MGGGLGGQFRGFDMGDPSTGTDADEVELQGLILSATHSSQLVDIDF